MTELHPPFMNYMGPGTKIEDRLSLNYKGKKGTKNYFIPTTYSDLVSFEHDLIYYSPDNVIKSYADAKFINDIRSIMGYAGIVAQYTRRLGIEGIYNYGVGLSVLSGIKSIYKDFMNAYKTGKDVVALTGTLKQLKELDKQIIDIARQQFGDLIRTPAHIQQNILQGQALFAETRQEVLTNREIFGRNVAFRLLPKLIFTGFLVAPKVIKSSKQLLRNALTFFVENPEYSEIQKRVDKVKDKYEKYLNEVGSFVDAPWYRSLVKSLKQPEGEKFFKVQSDINKDKSKQLYIEFYNEFKSYAEFMNEKYKDNKDYQPFNIEELNKDNLNKVYDIVDIPSSFIEEIFTKIAEKQKDVDGDKYTDEEQNKIIELNQEIEKVLKKEQDELFETPAPEPDDDDTIIDIPQEEITAILQGRQLKPFETPAEIRMGDNLPDFLE
tara:strand:- start:219 stop:1529 length:1311 start_codon:yes stop_codon:yes gene_type:complete